MWFFCKENKIIADGVKSVQATDNTFQPKYKERGGFKDNLVLFNLILIQQPHNHENPYVLTFMTTKIITDMESTCSNQPL